jgi:large subunit ribosomal protein L19
MDNKILQIVEGDQYKKRPEVRVGDTVKLYVKIKEGSKERVQMYQGVVISIKGSGASKNITVRKISYGVGVEKIVALNSPMLEKIEVVKRGSVRRSKLYYLRDRVGKKALKINKLEEVYFTDEEDVVEEPVVEEVVESEVVEEKVEEKSE